MDEINTVAFLDGAIVLAGLIEEERTLYGNKNDAKTILIPHAERQWGD